MLERGLVAKQVLDRELWVDESPTIGGNGGVITVASAKPERTLNTRGAGAHSGEIVTYSQLRGLHGGHLTVGQVALVPHHKNWLFGRILVVSQDLVAHILDRIIRRAA
jgi:hypothetical protein